MCLLKHSLFHLAHCLSSIANYFNGQQSACQLFFKTSFADKIREKFRETEEAQEFVSNLSDYCSQPFEFNKSIDEVVPRLWNFYNSFFFVVTVVSTIGRNFSAIKLADLSSFFLFIAGYGNLHPTTDPGRILMILYAIIGIPLNGILLTSLGQFFGAVVGIQLISI